jgi:hypothetical protein
LVHYIDLLIRTGEVADLAAVASMRGVSGSRVTTVVDLFAVDATGQKRLIISSSSASELI